MMTRRVFLFGLSLLALSTPGIGVRLAGAQSLKQVTLRIGGMT